MKESIWMYFFMVMGILGLVLINIFGNIVINNEQNYYLLKEVTEAAMYDSVDLNAYREGVGWDGVTMDTDPSSMHCEGGIPGTIRIVKEKFVESFARRFSASASLNRQYRIIIHDVDECPPKATISIISTERFSLVEMFNVYYEDPTTNIVNKLTGILETRTPDKYE